MVAPTTANLLEQASGRFSPTPDLVSGRAYSPTDNLVYTSAHPPLDTSAPANSASASSLMGRNVTDLNNNTNPETAQLGMAAIALKVMEFMIYVVLIALAAASVFSLTALSIACPVIMVGTVPTCLALIFGTVWSSNAINSQFNKWNTNLNPIQNP